MSSMFCLFELAWHSVQHVAPPLKLVKFTVRVCMAHSDHENAVLQGTIEIIPAAIPLAVLELDIDVIVKVSHYLHPDLSLLSYCTISLILAH